MAFNPKEKEEKAEMAYDEIRTKGLLLVGVILLPSCTKENKSGNAGAVSRIRKRKQKQSMRKQKVFLDSGIYHDIYHQ